MNADRLKDPCYPELSLIYTDRLQLAWYDLLSPIPWQWFINCTFKEEIHPEAADKLFRVWKHKLNIHVYGRNYYKKKDIGIKWVRSLEWQKRGVLHYHGLIADVGITPIKFATELWEELAQGSKAGFILILPYETGGVIGYITKYVAKGGQVDVCEHLKRTPIFPKVAHNDIPKLQDNIK